MTEHAKVPDGARWTLLRHASATVVVVGPAVPSEVEVMPVAEHEDYGRRVMPVLLQVENLQMEVDALRAALEDAAAYLRLGMTWITDSDRHSKMKRAWDRAREATA